LKSIGHIFTKLSAWDKDERFKFGGQTVRVQGHGWSNILKNAQFWAVLTRYLENYWTEFHQTFSVDAFWKKKECFNFWDQNVKGQGHSMAKSPAGEVVCRVQISNLLL